MMRLLGLLLTSFLVAIGTAWAFQRGGNDFAVFHQAWQLVLEGRGLEIYRVSPDRFLYAPGFAWLFSPLAIIPKGPGLAIWCLAKAAAVGFVIREFGTLVFPRESRLAAIGLASWAVVILARPLLIDFQYGQVNTFILAACIWALAGHFKHSEPSYWDGVKWFVFAIAAVTKIFPLPLLIVPWVLATEIPTSRIRYERYGVLLGLASILIVPAVSVGFNGSINLLAEWHGALTAKGLPLESHNQSFSAFLHHYFTAEPTHVISMGFTSILLGKDWFSSRMIDFVSMAWTAITAIFLLVWITKGKSKSTTKWVAVAIGLLIIPSHLVWKPYFVMGLPLAIVAISRIKWPVLVLVFAGINLTAFDFIGYDLAARLESASWLLWMHVALLLLAVIPLPCRYLRAERT